MRVHMMGCDSPLVEADLADGPDGARSLARVPEHEGSLRPIVDVGKDSEVAVKTVVLRRRLEVVGEKLRQALDALERRRAAISSNVASPRQRGLAQGGDDVSEALCDDFFAADAHGTRAIIMAILLGEHPPVALAAPPFHMRRSVLQSVSQSAVHG